MPTKKLEKSRPPAFEDDTSILPCDILFCILSKLPVKSLLRFQSVSKPWRVIILNTEFKKSQREQSKALGREKILQRKTDQFEFRGLENSKLIVMEKQRIPLKGSQRAQVLCSCDGLVLLKNHGAYKKFVLWNPSTREHQTLTCPYWNLKEIIFPTTCGLCYDSRVDDYKVIIMMSDSFYVVYSLNNNSWTEKMILSFPANLLGFCYTGISTEGRIFWSLHDQQFIPHVDRNSTIIYFDVKSNEVKKFPTPDFVGEDGIFQLGTLRSCLCLYGGKNTDEEFDIWIMEQDGRWKQLMNVRNFPTIYQGFIRGIKLLCYTKNGEVVFQKNYKQLYIYNPKRQQFVIVRDKNASHLKASVCLDSLYFSTPNV